MSLNFFLKKKNIYLKDLFQKQNIKNNFKIINVKPLDSAEKNDLSFFDSIKYKDMAFVQSWRMFDNNKLEKFLPQKLKIIENNVLSTREAIKNFSLC